MEEYNGFNDWLHSFPLYRGKKTSEDEDDDHRIVGKFKVCIDAYFRSLFLKVLGSLSICQVWLAEKKLFLVISNLKVQRRVHTFSPIPALLPTGVGELNGSDP